MNEKERLASLEARVDEGFLRLEQLLQSQVELFSSEIKATRKLFRQTTREVKDRLSSLEEADKENARVNTMVYLAGTVMALLIGSGTIMWLLKEVM